MNAPTKPWQEMTAAEKRVAVKAHIQSGKTYAKIADLIGAPNRCCIAGVVNRLRQTGELPPAPSKQETGAAGGAVGRIKAKARRGQMPASLHAGNIANKAESRKSDPGFKVTRAFAFDPLPDTPPVPFLENHGCKFPVDGVDGSGLLVCGAAKDFDRSYCDAHRALAYVPLPQRKRTARRAVERLSYGPRP